MSCTETLRELGYRLTPQRLMILAAIHSSDGHISAEEIAAQVQPKYPHMNISTVYRTLELMERLGLVTKTDMGEGILRYHHVEKGHHHHLVCRKCGRIFDLPEAALDTIRGTLMREYGFSPEFRHLAIFGRCSKCEN